MDKSKKILIVDDDADFVGSNKELLGAQGYEIFVAFDGAGGFELAKKTVPDLMILDVMMAYDTEGLDVARQVSGEPALRAMKVLLLSGITRQMNISFKLHADGNWLPVHKVLEKPIDPVRLLSVVEQMLGPKAGKAGGVRP